MRHRHRYTDSPMSHQPQKTKSSGKIVLTIESSTARCIDHSGRTFFPLYSTKDGIRAKILKTVIFLTLIFIVPTLRLTI